MSLASPKRPWLESGEDFPFGYGNFIHGPPSGNQDGWSSSGCGCPRPSAGLAHATHMRHLPGMPKMIQVRNVPDPLHAELTRRARERGETLTQYVQGILEREVARPPAMEVLERVRRRAPVELDRAVADVIREERARREGS